MRRLGVVLALLVLFSVLSVSVVPVRAETTYSAVAYLYTENEINMDLALSTLGGMVDGDHLLAYKSVGLSSPLEIRVYSQKIEVWYSGQSLNDLLPALRVLDPSDVATAGTVELSDIFLVNEAVQVFNDLVTNGAVSGNYYGLDLRFMPNGARVWYHYAVGRGSEGTTTGSTVTAGNNTYLVSFEGSAGNHIDDLVKVEIGGTVIVQTDGDYVKGYKVGSWSGSVVGSIQDSTGTSGYVYVILTYFDGDVVVSSPFGFLRYFDIGAYTATVTFSVKDALSGESLSGVTVKEGNTVLGTVDDGGTLEIGMGTHELTLEKSGYWSASVTVDVQADTSVNVGLYPDTAAFKFTNFPENLSFYVGTTNTLSFTVEPIETTATKNAYLRFSGITPERVTVNGAEVSPENGKYYLGDVTGPVSVSVTFKAPESSGTKSFSIAVESYDLTGNAYTTTKAVTYEVLQLPFIVNWPTWSVGENSLMIVEQSGESYLIEVSVTDANGSEIFADSHLFNPYESYTFSFNLPDTGAYTLTIRAKGGIITLEREISAAYPVELKTKTVTAAPGDVATVALELGNPGDQVVYYNVTLSGSVLGAPVTKAVSVAPGSTKTVYIDFKVPENPEFDAYALTVEVSTGGAVVFSDDVTLTISDEGFSLGLGGLSGSGPFGLPTWAWAGLGLVAVGLVVRSRKKRG